MSELANYFSIFSLFPTNPQENLTENPKPTTYNPQPTTLQPYNLQPTMRTFFKRFAIIMLVFVAVVMLSALIITAFFSDNLGRQIVGQLKKQLKTEMTVGKVDMTILSSFPYAAINLRQVKLKDTRGRNLLEAGNVSFRFGIYSLFGKQIEVSSLKVSDGALWVQLDKRGKTNYDVFKPSESDSPSAGKGPTIALREALLDNIELAYTDRQAGQNIRTLLENAAFTGRFNSSRFTLASKASLASRFIDIDSIRYLDGKKLAYDAKIAVDMEKGRYQLEEVSLTIEDNTFKAYGFIENRGKASYYDLYINNESGDLASLFQLLPGAYSAQIADLQSSGDFQVKALVKGLSGVGKTPQIRAEVILDDGRLSSPKMDGELKELSFLMTYDNGEYSAGGHSFFEIRDFKGFYERELLEMGLRLVNLSNPDIRFSMNGALPMHLIYGLLANPLLSEGSGEVDIQDLLLEGRLEDMKSEYRMSRVKATGALVFDDASLTVNNEKMIVDEGTLNLQDSVLRVSNFKLEGAGSDLLFNGQATHFIPVLFADSANTQRVELLFDASLSSQNLDIDRLLQITAVNPDQVDTTVVSIDSLKAEQIQQRERITQFLKGSFKARIAAFNYKLIEGSGFNGDFTFNNNELQIAGKTRAMGGAYDLRAQLFFEQEPRLNAWLVCQEVNITEFFRQADNFGQSVLTDQQLRGALNANIAINAYWDQEGRFLMDRLRVLAEVDINNGELIELEMLRGFSTFVKLKDLMHIRFVNMSNYLEVSNRKLYIPAMFIQSNALNLTVSGAHSFDNEIDYSVKVNAGQVISNRLKSHDPKLSPQPARKKGFFNLYYTIKGTIDEYEVKSAKRAVKTAFDNSERQKKRLREALETEFGAVRAINEPQEWGDGG